MNVIHFQPGHSITGSRRHGALEALNDATHWVIDTFRTWRWRAHERAQLSRLDDRMLRDIGLSRADREFLVNKPFWRE